MNEREFPQADKASQSAKIITLKIAQAAASSGGVPITPARPSSSPNSARQQGTIAFDRCELSAILRVYGYRVAEGEWRDYALDFGHERAVFSIFKRAQDVPAFQVEKRPKLARKQGTYCITNAAGMVLKRGHDLRQVLKVLEPRKHLHLID